MASHGQSKNALTTGGKKMTVRCLLISVRGETGTFVTPRDGRAHEHQPTSCMLAGVAETTGCTETGLAMPSQCQEQQQLSK